MIDNLEGYLKENISNDLISLNRVGGYSAENYVAIFDNNRKYFIKVLRENPMAYIAKLKTVISVLDKNHNLPFVSPLNIDESNNIIVYKYIDGVVLHGSDISERHCESIVQNVLHNFTLLPSDNLSEHSNSLFKNLDSSVREIKNLLISSRDSEHAELINDILCLKLSLIDKHASDQGLIDWIKNTNNFVHGDFHNENILFDGTSVAAVIDFELAHRGHPIEDAINFVWFAFLNSDFSSDNLARARTFLRFVTKNLRLSDMDVINGFKLMYIKLFSSAFLETSLLKYGGDLYPALLRRDLNKFKYIDDNLSTITNKLLKP